MKKDLKQFDYFASKDDLKALEFRLTGKFDNKFDKVLTAIDGLAKKVGDFQTELYSNQGFKDRIQKNLEAFEKRLIRVEIKTGIRQK